jgi:hypothetical protein
MGVMSCSRKECDNIMCDTYVDSVGYICNDCKSEFKEYLQKEGLNPKTEGQITKEIEKFMATSKDSYIDGNETSIDEFFEVRSR